MTFSEFLNKVATLAVGGGTTSLCCLCHKNTVSGNTSIEAPWVKVACTGHRGVLYCEVCFLHHVYDIKDMGMPNYFSDMDKPTCPVCAAEVTGFQDLHLLYKQCSNIKIGPAELTGSLEFFTFGFFTNMTLRAQMIFMHYRSFVVFATVRVLLAKLYPDAKSSLEFQKQASPMSKLLLKGSLDDIHIALVCSFVLLFRLESIFMDLYSSATTPDKYLTARIFERSIDTSLFKIFSLREVQTLFQPEAKAMQNLKATLGNGFVEYALECFEHMKTLSAKKYTEGPFGENHFVTRGKCYDVFVMTTDEENGTYKVVW